MKKIFTIMVCSILLGAGISNAQVAKVALSHNGNITMYNAEELRTALNASVDGDTLFLNEGTFSGNITISKKVSLIGAGQKTIINGFVIISLTGKLTSRMLDAIKINGSISVESKNNYLLDGLIIRKCSFYKFDTGTSLTNAIIDRCWQTRYENNQDVFTVHSNSQGSNVIKVINSIICCYNGYVTTQSLSQPQQSAVGMKVIAVNKP